MLIFLLTFLKKSETFANKINLNGWDLSEKNIKLFDELFRDIDKNIEVHDMWFTDYYKTNDNYEKNDNTIQVQITGESYYKNPDDFDINFIPAEKDSKNVIIFPFASHYALTNGNIDINKLIIKREYKEAKTKFCLFAVSHGGVESRIQFFNELSKYKNVDSCGKFMNNMTCPGTWGSPDYLEFLKDYKFMICFENKSQPNYFTEKLINSYIGGTIPIYWGCANIEDYVNLDSILYLPPNYTEKELNDLIKQIEYLDNDENAYKLKYESIFFKNGVLPDPFNVEKLREKINNRLLV
jgi:hypothetical protein